MAGPGWEQVTSPLLPAHPGLRHRLHSLLHGLQAGIHGSRPGWEVNVGLEGLGRCGQEQAVELGGPQFLHAGRPGPHQPRALSALRPGTAALTAPDEPPIFSSSRRDSWESSLAGLAGGGPSLSHSWIAAGGEGRRSEPLPTSTRPTAAEGRDPGLPSPIQCAAQRVRNGGWQAAPRQALLPGFKLLLGRHAVLGLYWDKPRGQRFCPPCSRLYLRCLARTGS